MNYGFPLVPLGEVLTKSKEQVEINPLQKYQQVTIKLWGRGVVLRDEVVGTEIAGAKRFVVRPQQFILSRIDARNGAFGLVPDFLDGAVVSNDFPAFTPNPSRILPAFLGWMSKTPGFVDLCKAASEGTTNRVRLKEDRFMTTKIPLPPLPEQRRIVARIEDLAARIEEARRLRRQAVEEANALVSSLHIHSSQPELTEIGEVLELNEQKEAVKIGQVYPQVGVRGFGQGLFAKEAVEGSQTTYKAFNRLYKGALVLSQVKGWEGAIAVCTTTLAGRYVSPEYRTFRCVPGKALPEYMSALVATPWFWSQLKNLTRGVGARRERTRPEQFLRMKILMPTLEQQEQALSLLEGLEAIKPMQAETAAELDALLPSVLDRAFKGKL